MHTTCIFKNFLVVFHAAGQFHQLIIMYFIPLANQVLSLEKNIIYVSFSAHTATGVHIKILAGMSEKK